MNSTRRSVFVYAAVAFATISVLPHSATAQTPAPRLNLNVRFADPVASTFAAPTPRTPRATTPFTWNGLYVGGLFGQAWGKSDASMTTVAVDDGFFSAESPADIAALSPQLLRPSKSVFGGQVGFVSQTGQFVAGAEGDFSLMKLEDLLEDEAEYTCCAPEGFRVTQSIKTTWMFTARGRAGVAVGPALVYGTAGLAMTDFDYEGLFEGIDSGGEIETGAIKETRKAFVWGGGGEFRGGARWSVRGEFLHANFGSLTTTSDNLDSDFGPFPLSVFTHTANLVVNVLRFGFNVGF